MGARKLLVAVVVQALLLMLVGGARAQAPASSSVGACAGDTQVPSDAASRQTATAAVLCLVNAERARRALRPVGVSAQLTRAAAGHSGDMVRRGYFSHVSPGGVGLRPRVARTGYVRGSRTLLGEALACGADAWATPAKLVQDVMADPAHRAIVLDARYRDIGIGLAIGAALEGMGDAGATLSLTFGRR